MPYLIYSTLTKKPFIDEKRRSYLFTEEQDAESFVADVPNTEPSELPELNWESVFSVCFAAGAEILKERRGNNKEVTHSIREEKLEKRFYNADTNANVSRYLHTGNDEYLKGIKNCKMIVPIRIMNDPYTKIDYPIIYKHKSKKGDYAFLAFTDIEEYNKWTEKDNGWDPLLVDNTAMRRIGGKHGLMVNVYSARLFIPVDFLGKYIAPKEEYDE